MKTIMLLNLLLMNKEKRVLTAPKRNWRHYASQTVLGLKKNSSPQKHLG